MDKKSFVLYTSYAEHIKKLSDEQRGKLMTAVFDYACDTKTDIELDAATDMLFGIIVQQLDYDHEKYEERCLINSQNGKKGGRPKKTEKTERFLQKPKKADNDNEYEYDYEYEYDNDTECDIDNENDIDNALDTECDNNINNTLGEERENKSSFSEKETPRGNYGFVSLTDEAFLRLKEKHGEKELKRLIEYLDESAASTNNKNGWKNWELVIERAAKGNWGRKHRQNENSKSPPLALNYQQKRYTDADLKAMGIEIFGE